jgi:hypothetical protein
LTLEDLFNTVQERDRMVKMGTMNNLNWSYSFKERYIKHGFNFGWKQNK